MASLKIKKGQIANLPVTKEEDTLYICKEGNLFYDYSNNERIELKEIDNNNNLKTQSYSLPFGKGVINRGGMSISLNPQALQLFNNTDIMQAFTIPKIGICQTSLQNELFFIFEIKITENEFNYFKTKYSNYMTELTQDSLGMGNFPYQIYNGWETNSITNNYELLKPFYLSVNDIPLNDDFYVETPDIPNPQLDLSKIFYYCINNTNTNKNYILYLRSNSIATRQAHTYQTKWSELIEHNNNCFDNNKTDSYALYYDSEEQGQINRISNSKELVPINNKFITLTISNSMVSGFSYGLNNRTTKNAFVFGDNLINTKYNSMVIGSYNAPNDSYAFSIGNGSQSSGRGNVFGITYNGRVNTTGAFATGGADYAEYFEWSQIPNIKDTRGLFVTLNKNKIKLANKDDKYIVGIISANPGVIGNEQAEEWQGKYKTDVFGTPLKDKNGQNILNPDYNAENKYIPREERLEWVPVGLIGQIIAIDDGTCKEGDFCYPGENGVATAANAGYYVMERLDNNHIKVLFK